MTMKSIGLITLIFGLTFLSCNQYRLKIDKSEKPISGISYKVSKNREEIQRLIRQVLIWSGSKESIDLLPVVKDSKDSIFIGFDMDKLQANCDILKQTGFFAPEFIENYSRIIMTIDKKIRNREIETWLVGDLPTFNFVNDINPWCQCQGFSKEDFDNIEVIKMDSKSGELKWKWKAGSSWNDFIFRVIKENDHWKISYMEGFDYQNSTK